MKIQGSSCVVTGGASGLGLATAKFLAGQGGAVVIADLPSSNGAAMAAELGGAVTFVPADITSASDLERVFDAAQANGELRAVVHCAGRGGALRVLDRDGEPGSLEQYEAIVRINLVGSFNVLRLAAARMAKNALVNGERGVLVLTASVAAYEGQIGQIPYASSKAGVVGMTLVAARDLAARAVRVCTIAPGLFDTPMLARLPEDARAALASGVPHPRRLGDAMEFAALAAHIIENPMLNGETIRLDGGLRMPPR